MYKKMVEKAKEMGVTNEQTMWDSIEEMEMILCHIKESNPHLYWSYIRKLHQSLYKGHYDEEFAMHDVGKNVYIGRTGERREGAYWSVQQIEDATKNMQFPTGTTKWDKYVAFNTFRADTAKSLTDEDAIKTAHEYFFNDLDFTKKDTTKIWEYMKIMRN